MISIIIPVYNMEKYIGRCLESLVSQTYSDLQIIIVDDGSTDNSGEIIKQFQKKDKRIEYYYFNNHGVSYARNKGMEYVDGELFCFVDPDDYLELDTLYSMSSVMRDDSIDIACATNFYIDSEDEIKKRKNHRSLPNHIIDSQKAIRYITDREIYNGVGGFIHTRLLRTKSFRYNGLWKVRFDEDILYGEGTLFLANCMIIAKKTMFVEGSFYHYYQRSDSSMHNIFRMVYNNESMVAYQRIIKLYEDNNIPTLDILLMKRFLVYKMINLANMSRDIGYYGNYREIVEVVRDNLPTYILLNFSHPSRIIWAFLSYKRIKNEAVKNRQN